jgi:hypothetical protein
MSTNILSSRDTNAHFRPASPEKKEPKSMEYHRQMLEERMKGEQ